MHLARMWCGLVTVLLVAGVAVLCVPLEDAPEDAAARTARDFDLGETREDDVQEKWRAVEQSSAGSQDWVPAEGPGPAPDVEEEPVVKRRRPGRKRKRRPQPLEYEDPYADRLPARPRPRRPQRLDQRREQWRDEMMAEEPFRPVRNYNRRRLYPKYDEDQQKDEAVLDDTPIRSDDASEQKSEIVVEKVRDPYTALNQDQGSRRRPYSKRKYPNEEQDTVTERERERETGQVTDRADVTNNNAVDLKTLLKQSGGISLSELLQQKNLSLADLLKGEQHAISALTGIPEATSEPYKHVIQESEVPNDDKPRRYNGGYRRLPSVRKHKQDMYNDDENQFMTEKRKLENAKVFISKTQSENEDTTERRIFVPSHPKYYTSVDYKPNMNALNIAKTTASISTTMAPEKTSESVSVVSSTVTFSTSENPTTIRSKSLLKIRPIHSLPPTLAKLKNLSAKSTMKSLVPSHTENYPKLSPVPPKAIKINIGELFGMEKLFNHTELSQTTEGPMKISVNLGQMIENSKLKESETDNLLVKNFTTTEQQPKMETEKIKELTAKDEIMEILSDADSRQTLTRLLESRNMTINELVEQRERGSSQRHLADIFHNQTKEPEPPEEMVVDEIIKPHSTSDYLDPPSLFEAFPMFDQQQNNDIPSKSSEDARYYLPMRDLPTKTRESRQNQLSSKESDDFNYINNPLFGTTTGKSNEIVGKFLPVWRQAYTNRDSSNQKEKILQDELLIKDEAKRIEEIENKLAEAVNGAFNIDLMNHNSYADDEEEMNEFFRLPYGVRSAIIASAIIVGISLFVFLTIFIVFKWTQKSKTQLAYTNSFSSSKIKSPILETPYQRRTFGSLMNATLGRKKRIPTISCSEPHSLQEYLWENDRKPFQ